MFLYFYLIYLFSNMFFEHFYIDVMKKEKLCIKQLVSICAVQKCIVFMNLYYKININIYGIYIYIVSKSIFL